MRHVAIRRRGWTSVLVALLLAWPIAGLALAAESTAGQVVTGTLTKLDLTEMKGLVRTDLGKPIFFTVTKPHLFQNLSVGARVTVEIDGEGRATKVIDASVVEFVTPAPEDSGNEAPPPLG